MRGKTWQISDPGLQEAAPSTSTSRWLAVVSALLICPSAHTVQWCRAMCANMYHTLEESSACVCSSSALDSVHWEMCFRVSLFLFDHFKRSVMYLVVCMFFRKTPQVIVHNSSHLLIYNYLFLYLDFYMFTFLTLFWVQLKWLILLFYLHDSA